MADRHLLQQEERNRLILPNMPLLFAPVSPAHRL